MNYLAEVDAMLVILNYSNEAIEQLKVTKFKIQNQKSKIEKDLILNFQKFILS